MGMVSFLLCDIAREAGAAVAAGRAGRADPAGRGRASWSRASGSARRASSPTPTRDARSALLDGGADPAWADAGASDPDRRRDREGEHDAHRAAQFHRPARHARAAPHGPGEHAALQAGVARLPPARPTRACCRRGPGASSTSRRCSIASVAPDGRAHDERVRPVRAAPVPRRDLGHAARGGRADGGRVDRPVLQQPAGRRSRRSRCWARRTSSDGWGSRAGTSSRGRSCRQYMWDRRLPARTPMPGVFLCGAGTHPGGSVIGINGRNAAMEVLAGG